MDVLVECKGLKKSYGKIPVIKELDLSLERGSLAPRWNYFRIYTKND